MKVLIVGCDGFIGRQFWHWGPGLGWDYDGCDLRSGIDAMALFRQAPAIRYDLVVHAAAREPHRFAIDNFPATTFYNRMLDAALFEWAVRTRQRRVLYFSSCAVLDEQPDAYGQAKLAGEDMAELARQAGVPVTVVRPYSGYGSDQDERFPFGAFAARANRHDDPFVIWGDGSQVRDWVHVEDVVRACLALVDAEVDGPVSICTGIGTSMRALVDLMCAEVGYQPRIELHAEKPAGVAFRVGDPTEMNRYYTPKVDLAEGVRRACRSR